MKKAQTKSINNNTLISDDIIPITSRKKALSGFGFANIWIGMAIVISVFSFGASGIEKMGVLGVASATFVANMIIALVGSLTGDIGVEHGLSFATYLRVPFGISGVHIPSVARGVIASCWFGINTYIGATAINYFTIALFGIDNWFLWFIIFTVVQVINTMLGIKAIDKFSTLAAPCIILITCWMFYKVNQLAALQNFSIMGYHPAQPSASYWFVTMSANMGMWAALAADIPNMTRSLKAPMGEKNWFKRNINNWIPQFATLPIIEAFIAIIGAISFKTTGNWNPVEVIQQQANGVSLIILLVMVILAQWSTNTAANLVPPAMCFTNAGAKWKLPYPVAVIIAGFIGCIVRPWDILEQLYTYLGYFGSILSSIAGIMICDYYILRKRRLNVQDLYKKEGQYRYHGGFNLCGMIALAVGTALANIFADFGYFFGFPAAAIVYFVLMKFWYIKKFPQAEIESDFSDEYLGVSASRDWIIPGYEKQAGYDTIQNVEVNVNTADFSGGKEYEERTGNRLVITFGRQYGSRGRELARVLGKRLDIPVYDEDMIKYTSQALDMPENKVRDVEEMQKKELLDLLTAGSIYAAKEYDASTTEKLFEIQSKIIIQLAKISPCIIVGRLSNYVLEQAGIKTIDVFVAANYEDRVKNIAERGNMTLQKAATQVSKKEKNREYYFNYFSPYEWGKPEYYDLCVNTSSMGLDDLAEHIDAYINSR